MSWEAWFTLAVVGAVFIGLVRGRAADMVLAGALTLLVVVGSLAGSAKLPTPADAVAGLGNSGLVTVAALFVVVAGLVQTGAMAMIAQPLLGNPRTVFAAQLRLLLPVTVISAFLNNTPVVAMFMPVVDDICKKTRISPSKLFLPMAYAATFGGVCTLIGTSTNLVVHGLLLKEGLPGFGMFELTWVGLPASALAIVYLLSCGRWLLPDRQPAINLTEDPRQYTLEMLVQRSGPLVGQTIEQAGLRQLPGLYLLEIDREGEILQAVGPQQRLAAGDRLVFVGIVESVVDLQKIRGIAPATDQTFKLDAPRSERCLIEAVVSDRCRLIGKSIREGQFRSVYNAAVIAVARGGKRIHAKIGDIVLQAGDTLLLEAHQDFVSQQRNASDFLLVSGIENSAPPRHDLAWVALGILLAMVTVVALNWLDLLAAALCAASLMVLTHCCTGAEARRSIDWSLLLVIAAALGIGKTIETSGLAAVVGERIISLAGSNPWLVLAAVYFVTMLFTELITNNAAAILSFPIALAVSKDLEVSFLPFAIAVAIAASAGFSTPFGYQTNLMVYGPGGYRFADYLRVGIPLNLLFMLVTVALTPLVFPF